MTIIYWSQGWDTEGAGSKSPPLSASWVGELCAGEKGVPLFWEGLRVRELCTEGVGGGESSILGEDGGHWVT